MNYSDIIFATTSDHPGFCEVTLYDGSNELISIGIGELYKDCNKISNRGRYFMIGRSALICENNIVMINPSKRKLVVGCDSLDKPHQVLEFSDDLLRELRRSISE